MAYPANNEEFITNLEAYLVELIAAMENRIQEYTEKLLPDNYPGGNRGYYNQELSAARNRKDGFELVQYYINCNKPEYHEARQEALREMLAERKRKREEQEQEA